MNAKQELLDHIGSRQVEYVVIDREHDDHKSERIEGRLDDALEKLDFEYDNDYGCQYLAGTIWYTDGTWSERGEYDGSEWWEHKERPPLPTAKPEPETRFYAAHMKFTMGQWKGVDEHQVPELLTRGYRVSKWTEVLE